MSVSKIYWGKMSYYTKNSNGENVWGEIVRHLSIDNDFNFNNDFVVHSVI